MGRCDDTAGKGVRALRKIKKRLALLAAGLALAVMTTGCSSGAAQPVNGFDTQIAESGRRLFHAQMFCLEIGVVEAVHEEIDQVRTHGLGHTQKYNRYSAPTSPGLTRMARLFLYPGDWPEDEVARAALITIQEMEAELSQRSRQVVIDSYYTYTYDYSISVQQVYGDQNTAWVVGIGINQTTKEEHKT